ncbi:MAG: hypothetical protein WBQ79_19895 [Acidobacteriaceae bacterium]
MRFLTFDAIAVVAGMLLQAWLCVVLLRKGLARLYPIFFIYLLLNIAEDPFSLTLNSYSAGYRQFYFVVTILDYILQLLIVFEIGKNVLRPSKRSLPFPIAPVAVVGVLLCALVAASFSRQVQAVGTGDLIQLSLRVSLGLAVLKLLLFAALAGFAQMLGIGWKSHVLQLATGLAFYAGVSLLIQISSSHVSEADTSYIHHLDRLMDIQTVAFVGTLVFWTWAFSRNEAPRKDFTPQMQEVLVTIAQSAKRTRLAVTRSTDRR